MRSERNHFGFGTLAKSGLAGFLVLLLLLAVTFSASHTLHYALHPSPASSHFCLVCSLLQGQLSVTEAGFELAVLLLGFLLGGRIAATSPVFEFDFRLSHSRAPPCA